MNVEQMLRSAGQEIDWPATPDFDIDCWVEGSIDPLSQQSTRGRRFIWRPAAIAFAALLLLAGTAMAIPGVRDPVLDWLGLRSVHIERVPRPLPETPRGSRLGLGDHTTLANARGRLGFNPVVATGLGAPVVYYDAFPDGGQLALVYPHHVLTQVEGSIQREYLDKFLQPGTGVTAVRIDGERGLWIHGQVHQYAYVDRTGQIRSDSVRTAGDVLLWRRGDLLLRLEGARSKAEALRVAASLRAAP